MKPFSCGLSISTPACLYHGSSKHFVEGTLLVAQPDGYVAQINDGGSNLEQLFENRRPVNMTSRAQSVYMSADPDLIDASGGSIDAIYKVEPIGNAELSDLAWYTEAQLELEKDVPDEFYRVDLL
jgi:hypothetical protein